VESRRRCTAVDASTIDRAALTRSQPVEARAPDAIGVANRPHWAAIVGAIANATAVSGFSDTFGIRRSDTFRR
jgi:hypothetical protein